MTVFNTAALMSFRRRVQRIDGRDPVAELVSLGVAPTFFMDRQDQGFCEPASTSWCIIAPGSLILSLMPFSLLSPLFSSPRSWNQVAGILPHHHLPRHWLPARANDEVCGKDHISNSCTHVYLFTAISKKHSPFCRKAAGANPRGHAFSHLLSSPQ